MSLRSQKRRNNHQHGSLLFELMVSIPLLFTLMAGLGVVSFPMLDHSLMQDAAKIGARIGSLPPISQETMASRCMYAAEAVKEALKNSGKNAGEYEVEAKVIDASPNSSTTASNSGQPATYSGNMAHRLYAMEVSVIHKVGASRWFGFYNAFSARQPARSVYYLEDQEDTYCSYTGAESPTTSNEG